MGGQPAACQTTAATPADPTINICPAGWRLPVGSAFNDNTNELWNLNQAINSGATNTPSGLLTNSLFQYGGWFSTGSFLNVGINGAYWSSTVDDATFSRILILNAGAVSSASNAVKGVGLTVRCVRD